MLKGLLSTKPWIALGALLFASMAQAEGAAPNVAKEFPKPVYVALQKANAVEVLPEGRLIPGLTSAHYVAVSPDGKLLVVGSFTTGDVFVVDTRTDKTLATIDTGGKTVQGVVVTPDNRYAMAVDPNNGLVDVIDLEQMKLIRKIPVGTVPHNVAFAPDGKLAYVTLQGGTGVAVVDMKTFAKIGEIPVPGIFGPHNLDFSDHGKIMWVRDIVGHVAVVDVASQKELAVVGVGHGHAGIDVLPGGKYVATGAIADDVVDIIDAKTFTLVKSIVVGKGPHGVRSSPDGRWIYTDNTGSGTVSVIDTKTLAVVATIPTKGAFPFWIAVPWHT